MEELKTWEFAGWVIEELKKKTTNLERPEILQSGNPQYPKVVCISERCLIFRNLF